MENLKNEILNGIPSYDPSEIEWHGLEGFENLVYEKYGVKIYGDAIQAALDTHKCVKIPKTETLYIEKPIMMGSGYRLILDKEQVIANVPGTPTCLIRNKTMFNGAFEAVPTDKRDSNISVEGGIWDGGIGDGEWDGDELHGVKVSRLVTGDDPVFQGALAIMIFSNVENLILKDAEFKNGGESYATQICNIKHFHISGLTFIKYGRDGVHVNGPASYGEICNLRGVDMKDDMVALNAWDWDTSAISFGTIEFMYVHDNESKNNELRLLPGRKMYDNDYVDCDIRNSILETLSGIYTFKLYCQPNIKNAYIPGYHDVSGAVGNIYNVWFKNIVVNENKAGGFNDLPVNGIFDVCANCHDIHFEDIKVTFSMDELKEKNMCLVSVGPLSAVWKHGSDNPDDWGEVFAPDAICHVEDFYFKNITFEGEAVNNPAELVREVHMTVNEDYPNTTPKGGTGYGTVGRLIVE